MRFVGTPRRRLMHADNHAAPAAAGRAAAAAADAVLLSAKEILLLEGISRPSNGFRIDATVIVAVSFGVTFRLLISIICIVAIGDVIVFVDFIDDVTDGLMPFPVPVLCYSGPVAVAVLVLVIIAAAGTTAVTVTGRWFGRHRCFVDRCLEQMLRIETGDNAEHSVQLESDLERLKCCVSCLLRLFVR